MKVVAAIGAVVGLTLARMAYLMFAVPQQNCSDACPADPSSWPWLGAGALAGVTVAILARAWVRRLQRVGLRAFR